MATFKHPDLPGQLISGYSDDAAETLAASGWVDINTPDPKPGPDEVSATHPEGEADDKPAAKKK